MFTFLYNIVKGIGDLWNAIVGFANFLINAINSLISLVAHIPEYMSFIASSINVLPAIVIPFALAGITIFVVLFFIGR